MSDIDKSHLIKIAESIQNSPKLSQEEKSSSVKIVEEWIAEDRGFGLLFEKLMNISEEIEPILIEMGLV